jgi:hypothetical protein
MAQIIAQIIIVAVYVYQLVKTLSALNRTTNTNNNTSCDVSFQQIQKSYLILQLFDKQIDKENSTLDVTEITTEKIGLEQALDFKILLY